MARARNIKPGFFLNEELAEIEPLGRILFQGLWCVADRRGRLRDRPRRIKAEVLPYDDVDVDTLLNELTNKGFLIRYGSCDGQYIQIVNFEKHQNPHKNEGESTIPAPPAPSEFGQAPEEHHASTVQAPEEHSTTPADSLNLIPDSLIPEVVNPDGFTPAPIPIRPDPDPKPVRSQPKQRTRAPDPIFDTLCEVLAIDATLLTSSERGRLNSACKQIRDVDGTPDQIRTVARRYREKWPKIDITASAIAGNWGHLLMGSTQDTKPLYETMYPVWGPDHPSWIEGLNGQGRQADRTHHEPQK